MLPRYTAFLALYFVAATNVAAADDDPRGNIVTLGYIENIAVGKLGLEMKGKLDTGADTSSVHAHNVKVYKGAARKTIGCGSA